MAQKTEERGIATGLVVGVIGGGAVATLIATLLAARPARAAPTDEKLDYLIEVLTTLVPVLAELSERQATLTDLLRQWLVTQVPGVPGAIAVSVSTPWIAKDPEIIFQQAVRNAGVFFSDHMVDFRNAKRMVIKAESSLDQNVIIQVIGNISDTPNLATDLGAPIVCPANGNSDIGIGTNDDWRPYIGVRITVGALPTLGMLTVWAVIQE